MQQYFSVYSEKIIFIINSVCLNCWTQQQWKTGPSRKISLFSLKLCKLVSLYKLQSLNNQSNNFKFTPYYFNIEQLLILIFVLSFTFILTRICTRTRMKFENNFIYNWFNRICWTTVVVFDALCDYNSVYREHQRFIFVHILNLIYM